MVASIGDRWEAFVAAIVSSGRYSSARDVVQEGPRLVEERKAKLSALCDKFNAAIPDGGLTSDDGIGALPETSRSIGKVMDARADFDRLERPGLNVNGTAPWRLTTRSLTRLSRSHWWALLDIGTPVRIRVRGIALAMVCRHAFVPAHALPR